MKVCIFFCCYDFYIFGYKRDEGIIIMIYMFLIGVDNCKVIKLSLCGLNLLSFVNMFLYRLYSFVFYYKIIFCFILV